MEGDCRCFIGARRERGRDPVSRDDERLVEYRYPIGISSDNGVGILLSDMSGRVFRAYQDVVRLRSMSDRMVLLVKMDQHLPICLHICFVEGKSVRKNFQHERRSQRRESELNRRKFWTCDHDYDC